MKRWLGLWCILVGNVAAGGQTLGGQTPPEYCHYIVNWFHCGHADERRPRERLVLETIPAYAMDMIEDTDLESIHLPAPNVEIRPMWQGTTEQLARRGHTLYLESLRIPERCPPGQEYIYSASIRTVGVTVTFTCAKNGLFLLGPKITNYVSGTWQLVPSGGK